MIYLIFLLASYGICFGMMNKLPFLYSKHKYLDSLLTCAYCSGFWASLISALMFLPLSWQTLPGYALAGAIFCYIADTIMAKVEEFGTDA